METFDPPQSLEGQSYEECKIIQDVVPGFVPKLEFRWFTKTEETDEVDVEGKGEAEHVVDIYKPSYNM